MKNVGHIVWYADLKKLDLQDKWLRKWWIKQVLIHGRMDDLRCLDWDEVKVLLPSLRIPKRIYSLWEDYFQCKS